MTKRTEQGSFPEGSLGFTRSDRSDNTERERESDRQKGRLKGRERERDVRQQRRADWERNTADHDRDADALTEAPHNSSTLAPQNPQLVEQSEIHV
ncbi:hypothetical protein Q5P01_025907 [Channa striata]|uniref:Uncharacterized protein n=1 Tax=Channa striata TaxID=64152 RepID=A0AA88IZ18_CHASR|nr:hypothetical protein Q5P01_025907 [Channa striata]